MLRRCTPPREQAPRCGHDHLGETAYKVRLSLLGTRLPLFLLAMLFVACFFIGESPEGPTASVRCVLENSTVIETMAFARDGTLVANTDLAGIVQLWRPKTGRRQLLLGQNPVHATCVAFAPDGATLAIGDMNSTVSIWDVVSGSIRWSVSGQIDKPRALSFSPDGATLASGGDDRCVCLWDVPTRRLRARLTGHSESVTVLSFAPDGRTVVSGSQDGTIRCWDAATSEARWVMPARLDDHDYGLYPPTVLCVRFSPDGQTLATASVRDPTVRLRDPATGQVRMSLLGPAHTVTSVDFAPDGSTLLAGDSRGSLTFWDMKSRHPRSTWKVHNNWVNSVAFSGDGRTFASAGGVVVKLWEVSAHEEE